MRNGNLSIKQLEKLYQVDTKGFEEGEDGETCEITLEDLLKGAETDGDAE